MRSTDRYDDLAEERDGFRFRGGHPVIDLPATLQARLKPAPRELLGTPHDLARWLVAARPMSARPEPTGEAPLGADGLREAIYALANARPPDGPDPSDACDELNTIAAKPAA